MARSEATRPGLARSALIGIAKILAGRREAIAAKVRSGPNAPAGRFVLIAEEDSGITNFVSAGPARDEDMLRSKDSEAGPMRAEIHALYLAGRASGQGCPPRASAEATRCSARHTPTSP